MITHQTPDRILRHTLIMMLCDSAVLLWNGGLPYLNVSFLLLLLLQLLIPQNVPDKWTRESSHSTDSEKHRTEAASPEDEVGDGNKLN